MPWRTPGVEAQRTWVVAPSRQILEERWRHLVAGPPEERDSLLRANRDRDIHSTPRFLPGLGDPSQPMSPLANASADEPMPPIVSYGFRSFDRQWLLADHRLISYARPDLWRVESAPGQLFLTTLHAARPLGPGPAVVATAALPDRHHFRGSFGGAMLPLWRDPSGTQANLLPGLLSYLSRLYAQEVTPPAFVAYLAAVLAHPEYTRRFAEELHEATGPRVPITRDRGLFATAATLGARVLWLQTYAARYSDPEAERPARIVRGAARAVVPIPAHPDRRPTSFRHDPQTHTLHVGEGTFSPVAPEVMRYEVSGMRVLNKWLDYRIATPAVGGRSPLDEVTVARWPFEWTHELLELLWMLEALIALEPQQHALLDEIMAGSLLTSAELLELDLLPVPGEARQPVCTSWTGQQSDQLDLPLQE
jgi:Type ISP C-terminal specificity domain